MDSSQRQSQVAAASENSVSGQQLIGEPSVASPGNYVESLRGPITLTKIKCKKTVPTSKKSQVSSKNSSNNVSKQAKLKPNSGVVKRTGGRPRKDGQTTKSITVPDVAALLPKQVLMDRYLRTNENQRDQSCSSVIGSAKKF